MVSAPEEARQEAAAVKQTQPNPHLMLPKWQTEWNTVRYDTRFAYNKPQIVCVCARPFCATRGPLLLIRKHN